MPTFKNLEKILKKRVVTPGNDKNYVKRANINF